MTKLTRADLHARLHASDLYEFAWSLDSLPSEWHSVIADALTDWVIDYNENFCCRESDLIPACWPAHPGLTREIAAMYSYWVEVFHTASGSAESATYFYDRALPGFQQRIPGWLGMSGDACRAGKHPIEWHSAVAKVEQVSRMAADTRQRLRERYLPSLAGTRSAPAQRPLVTNDSLLDLRSPPTN